MRRGYSEIGCWSRWGRPRGAGWAFQRDWCPASPYSAPPSPSSTQNYYRAATPHYWVTNQPNSTKAPPASSAHHRCQRSRSRPYQPPAASTACLTRPNCWWLSLGSCPAASATSATNSTPASPPEWPATSAPLPLAFWSRWAATGALPFFVFSHRTFDRHFIEWCWFSPRYCAVLQPYHYHPQQLFYWQPVLPLSSFLALCDSSAPWPPSSNWSSVCAHSSWHSQPRPCPSKCHSARSCGSQRLWTPRCACWCFLPYYFNSACSSSSFSLYFEFL